MPTMPMKAPGAGIGNFIAAKSTPTRKPARSALRSSIMYSILQSIRDLLKHEKHNFYRIPFIQYGRNKEIRERNISNGI